MKMGTFRRVEVTGLPQGLGWIQDEDNPPHPDQVIIDVVKINFDDEMEAEDRANSATWTSSFL